MSSTPLSPADGGPIPLDQAATREFFEGVFHRIHERLAPLELSKADYEAAIDAITTQALAIVTANITAEVDTQRARIAAISVDINDVLAAIAQATSGVTAATTPVQAVDGLTGNSVQLVLNAIGVALKLKAPSDSPTLTGNPTAPTPTPGDNDTSIATTAFVKVATDALSAAVDDRLVATRKGLKNSFRNKLINGNFAIWQRATEFYWGNGGVPTPYQADDRWTNVKSAGGSFGVSRFENGIATKLNSRWRSRTQFAGGNGPLEFIVKSQSIEGVRTLAGKTAVLSFNAAATTPGKYLGVELMQVFGSGGSPSPILNSIGAQKFLLGTDIENDPRFSVKIDIPSLFGKTEGSNGDSCLRLLFWFSGGGDTGYRNGGMPVAQAGTIDIADVQLEEGDVATPFEGRPLTIEQELCKRYFEIVYASGRYASNRANDYMEFPVPLVHKRVDPTMTVLDPTSGTGSSNLKDDNNLNRPVYVISHGQNVGRLGLRASAANVDTYALRWPIAFDAEL